MYSIYSILHIHACVKLVKQSLRNGVGGARAAWWPDTPHCGNSTPNDNSSSSNLAFNMNMVQSTRTLTPWTWGTITAVLLLLRYWNKLWHRLNDIGKYNASERAIDSTRPPDQVFKIDCLQWEPWWGLIDRGFAPSIFSKNFINYKFSCKCSMSSIWHCYCANSPET